MATERFRKNNFYKVCKIQYNIWHLLQPYKGTEKETRIHTLLFITSQPVIFINPIKYNFQYFILFGTSLLGQALGDMQQNKLGLPSRKAQGTVEVKN